LCALLQLVSVTEWSNRYVLRDPDTVLDILDGSKLAIATMLKALKKRWELVEQQVHQRDRMEAQLQRQISKNSLLMPAKSGNNDKVKSPMQTWNASTQREVLKKDNVECYRHYHKKSSVSRMVDAGQVACVDLTKQERNEVKAFAINEANAKLETAYTICKWIRSLGIPLRFDELETNSDKFTQESFLSSGVEVFKDGVTLCQLTAVIIYQVGDTNAKAKLRPVLELPGTFVPQGCCLHPQTLAQKRHNFQLALTILKEIPSITHPIVCSLELQDPLSAAFPEQIWILLHVLYKIARSKSKRIPSRLIPSSELLESSDELQSPPPPPSQTNNFPCVTPEQVNCVREWIRYLGIGDSKAINLGLLEDPYRNGTHLCHVLNRFVSQDREIHYHHHPKSLYQAKSNIQAAFYCIYKHRISLPPIYRLLANGHGLLKGHYHAVWGFWWHIYQALQVPSTIENINSKVSDVLEKQKILVIEWIRAQGYLHGIKQTNHPTFDNLKSYFENGSLLLYIAAKVTNHDIDIKPTSSNCPKSVALFNIQQALDLLRTISDMPQRYLWSEDKIYSGDASVLLGLLSDLQETLKKAQPARVLPIEKQFLIKSDDSREPEHLIPIREEEDEYVPCEYQPRMECFYTHSSLSSSRQWREIDIDTTQDLHPRPSNFEEEIFEEESYRKIIPIPHTPPSQTLLHKVPLGKLDKPILPKRPVFEAQKIDTEPLISWLQHLQIKQLPNLEDRVLKCFSNGLLLVAIVEKIEHIRTLEGVCHQPNKKAQALHNIKKALDILRLKKTMPLTLLRKDREIYHGDRDIILMLLDQIRKAYGYHHLVVVK
ncbi:hypothetical protein THRCLA_08283, partial [Thraustotheca clavata]